MGRPAGNDPVIARKLRTTVSESVPELAAEIRVVAEQGASDEVLADRQSLLQLQRVVGRATEDGRDAARMDRLIAALREELRAACDALEEHPERETTPNEAMAAHATLGLRKGTEMRPLRGSKNRPGRLTTIAEHLDIRVETVTHGNPSPLDRLIEKIARALVWRETEYAAEELRLAQRAHRQPAESQLRVDWVTRFEDYYRVWTPIVALAVDVRVVLTTGDSTDPDREHFLIKALYYYSQYVTHLQDFTEAHGGFWFLADAATDQRVANAVVRIGHEGPFTELDDSFLRKRYKSAVELVDWWPSESDSLAEYLDKWRKWVEGCLTPQPAGPCHVHGMLMACDQFAVGIDQSWDAVVDWYPSARSTPALDLVRMRQDRRMEKR